jgi:dipeptidyl aminopeptidase/acylaminoacyl peptidase
MQPAWHPDGRHIAWIAWDFPNMPWDGTFLRVGTLSTVTEDAPGLPALEQVATIAGDETTSIFQPEFSPDGRLLAYVSDATGWWQLYVYDLESGEHRQLTFIEAEHGAPAWVQGVRTYGITPDSQKLVFIRNQEGINSLWQLELDTGAEAPLPLDETYSSLDGIAVSPDGREVALLASGARQPARVIRFRLPGSAAARVQVLRRATAEDLPPETYSEPEPRRWAGHDGETVHGLFYPPHNLGFAGIGKPPLVVSVHGGPTSQARSAFNPRSQFFTSRGYAYLDVNYRGSTGYGRAYRDQLRGNWGIFDVQDAVSGARGLVEAGTVDGSKLVIIGGSAGGYTVLQALVDFPGFFKAGICLYGISNQFTAATETHKFEQSYSDLLLGPLPEAAEIYRQRSPINFADKIQDPVAFYQGEEDVVVPRNQSDEMVASLQRRGVPHIYHVYPGEGHGFRKAENIAHLYQTIEAFLQQYVIFT